MPETTVVKLNQPEIVTQATGAANWAETLTIDLRSRQDAHRVPVTLALPTGDLGTWLSDALPCSWEIEAKGETHEIDSAARFLLPVYSRNGR
jgi:hypothetical protein